MQIAAGEQTAVLMEDLQWADPESIGWLDHMLGRAGSRPLFVMAMVRPEFRTRDTAAADTASGDTSH